MPEKREKKEKEYQKKFSLYQKEPCLEAENDIMSDNSD